MSVELLELPAHGIAGLPEDLGSWAKEAVLIEPKVADVGLVVDDAPEGFVPSTRLMGCTLDRKYYGVRQFVSEIETVETPSSEVEDMSSVVAGSSFEPEPQYTDLATVHSLAERAQRRRNSKGAKFWRTVTALGLPIAGLAVASRASASTGNQMTVGVRLSAETYPGCVTVRYTGEKELWPQDCGKKVYQMQTILASEGFIPADTPLTGFYGNATWQAVRRLEDCNPKDLVGPVDGLIDPKTYKYMMSGNILYNEAACANARFETTTTLDPTPPVIAPTTIAPQQPDTGCGVYICYDGAPANSWQSSIDGATVVATAGRNNTIDCKNVSGNPRCRVNGGKNWIPMGKGFEDVHYRSVNGPACVAVRRCVISHVEGAPEPPPTTQGSATTVARRTDDPNSCDPNKNLVPPPGCTFGESKDDDDGAIEFVGGVVGTTAEGLAAAVAWIVGTAGNGIDWYKRTADGLERKIPCMPIKGDEPDWCLGREEDPANRK